MTLYQSRWISNWNVKGRMPEANWIAHLLQYGLSPTKGSEKAPPLDCLDLFLGASMQIGL